MTVTGALRGRYEPQFEQDFDSQAAENFVTVWREVKVMRLRYLVFLFMLIGCTTSAEPTPIPATATTASPTDTPPPPTQTATPLPTDTPSPTNTPEPTATPLPTDTPPPTDTPSPTNTPVSSVPRFPVAGQFTIYGEQPAVPNGREQFTDPGGVIFHDGQFHMFHNAFTGWPATVEVLYSISADGLTWELVQDDPVFEGNELSYAGVAALASSVVVLDDGRWAMYFYTWDDRSWPISAGSIGVATAASPLGPWTALAEPILTAGAGDAWDNLAVRAPSVVKTEVGYVMYYGGFQRDTAAIGRAFSADGLTWEKDPNNPVFVGSADGYWDAKEVYQPRVRQTPDGLVMLYTATNRISSTSLFQDHGLAFSLDGENWTRSQTSIFAARDANERGRNIWFTELTYADGTYFIQFELGTSNMTEIYIATFEGAILSAE